MRQLMFPRTHMGKRTRTLLLLLSGCGLSLSLLNIPVQAQTAQEGRKEGDKSEGTKGEGQKAEAQKTEAQKPEDKTQKPEEPSASPDLPILLLVVQRPPGTPAKRDDINNALSLMLRTSVRESRKYQVILYNVEHPSIRRALIEHAIAASELVEPVAPAALQKLAGVINAHSILMVSSTLDKVGLKTDVRLIQDAGSDVWITPLSQPFMVDAQIGKLRLKTDQLLALTVDNIDKYLGIPSHLADNIHLSKTIIIGGPTSKKDKNARAAKNSKDKTKDDGKIAKNTTDTPQANDDGQSVDSQKTTDTAANTRPNSTSGSRAADVSAGKSGGADSSTGNNAVAAQDTTATEKTANTNTKTDAPKATKPPVKIARNTPKSRSAADKASGPNGSGANPANGVSDGTPAALERVTVDSIKNDTNNRKNQPALLNTDAGASLLTEPTLIPAVPPTDKVNYEAAADRYRQTGDLPNSILSLRQAINENPRDLHLRKKLIVAYQDRQLPDMAASEIERAVQMAPSDADLSRLHASSLLGKGDTTNAIKMLRDVIATNPKDIPAQVALGDALLADSQFAEAISAFEGAAKNDPKSPLPHRRLARVLAARAGSDTTQYAACLQQIEQARALTPATETQTYQGDYFEIMLLLESRLKDILDQVNETFAGVGKRANADLMQHATDLKERAEAAADFLDKLPPAAGQDITHAHYGQGAALLVQTIGYLRKFIPSGEAQTGNSLRATRIDALTEFNNAHTRLIAARASLEKGRAATGVSTN